MKSEHLELLYIYLNEVMIVDNPVYIDVFCQNLQLMYRWKVLGAFPDPNGVAKQRSEGSFTLAAPPPAILIVWITDICPSV